MRSHQTGNGALIRFGALFAFVLTCAVALSMSFGSSATAVTVLGAGGTGNPSGAGMQHQVSAAYAPAGSTHVALATPEEFWPVSGNKTYDQSRNEGTAIMVTAVKNAQGKTVLQGYSQSAVSAEEAAKKLQVQGVPFDKLSLLLSGNPERDGPTKGVAATFAGMGAPGFISFDKNPAASTYQKTDVCRQYDMICDTPQDIDPVKWANVVAGYFEIHPNYTNVNMSNAKVTKVGNTTYVDVPTATPPIISVLRKAGVPISPQIENDVKRYIDTSNWAPKLAPILNGLQGKATPVPLAVQQSTIAPAPAANPTQKMINDGIQAAENWANTQPVQVKQVVEQVTKFVAPQAAVQQIVKKDTTPASSAPAVNQVNQMATQAHQAVDHANLGGAAAPIHNVINQGQAFLAGLGIR